MTDGECIRAGFMVFLGAWLCLLLITIGVAFGAIIMRELF